MAEKYLSSDPSTAVERGFLTGRPLTIGGIRAISLETAKSSLALVQVFFTEMVDGVRRIINARYRYGWGDNVIPSKDRKGFVGAPGAARPGLEIGSEWHDFTLALKAHDCPTKLLSGPLTNLLGMAVELVSKPQRAFKKAIDAEAKQEVRMFAVPGEIVTLPADNSNFTPLTDKEIDKYLADRAAKRAAREDTVATDEDPADEEEEEEKPEPVKKGKVVAPVEDDDEEEEEEKKEEPAAEEDDEEEEADDEDDADTAALKLATSKVKGIIKAMKSNGKTKIPVQELYQDAHALFPPDTAKAVKTTATKFIQSEKFLAKLGITVKAGIARF